MANTGVLYIATGEQFVEEAEQSAQSVRNSMPDIPIAIATDRTPSNLFDHVIEMDNPKYGFVDQIHALDLTPFDRTLCLDTDIYMDADVSDVFEVLDEFDIAATHDHERVAFDVPNVPKCFPEYNTGVIAYKNTPQFQAFLDDWVTNYRTLIQEDNRQNQPSFRKSLYECSLRVATLPPEYNLMLRFPGHAVGEVRIFHGRLLDIETPGAGKYVDVTEAVEKINSMEEHRVFTQLGGLTVRSNDETNLVNRIRMGLFRYGVLGAGKRALQKIS